MAHVKSKSKIIEDDKFIEPILYKPEEEEFIAALQTRLEKAREQRDTTHDEFDGKTFIQYTDDNVKQAINFLKPKKNREDSNYQSGTIRQKLFTFLAQLTNLNLDPDIEAHDDQENQIKHLGDAMEDIILKTEENQALAGDNESKMMRQYNLLMHGTVFVEDIWEKKWQLKKQTQGEFDGKINSVKWTERLEKVFDGPQRRVIPIDGVYLGDMTQFDMEKQPYTFTIEYIDAKEAESIYGTWERWKFVDTEAPTNLGMSQNISIFNNQWRFAVVKGNQVEIIKYQDQFNNEYQILINGVLMFPLGFPLSVISPDGKYTIVKQVLEPFHERFAYGKSFISKLIANVAVLDELLRLAVLKTQKSFMPPMLNLTGKFITRRVFLPGKITMGIQPGQLQPVSAQDAEGVTNSEFNLITELQRNLDQLSASQTFGGQIEGTKVTATQILESQRQARIILGLMIFAAAMLEKKLAHKRLENLLENWFNPIDQEVDEARNLLRERFRTISVTRTFDREGQGRRIVSVVSPDEVPTVEAITQEQRTLSEREGQPVKKIYLPSDLRQRIKLTWIINIIPRERKTNELSKILFGQMVGDAINIFGPTLNLDFFQERFAEIWEIPLDRAFKRGGQPTEMPEQRPTERREEPRRLGPGAEATAPGIRQLLGARSE